MGREKGSVGQLPERGQTIWWGNIKKLPSDIGRLQYLETLDIRDTYVKELPSSVGRLQQIVHLLGGNRSKRLALQLTEAIVKMTALQTLSGIEISKSSAAALGNIHNLTSSGSQASTILRTLMLTSIMIN
ncbi:hypothetical protein ACP4OV_009102 [Aristida adscensionis]